MLIAHYIALCDGKVHRIAEQCRQLECERSSPKRQLAELRQARADEEGLRRFCKIATRNLNALDDTRWRILLETMRLSVLIDDGRITVKITVPSMKDEQRIIASRTPQNSDIRMTR